MAKRKKKPSIKPTRGVTRRAEKRRRLTSKSSSESGAEATPRRRRSFRLRFNMLPQPDDSSCGPTCLHAIYRYHGLDIELETVVAETGALEEGGTFAVLLGSHALRNGFQATIYTFNIQVFDPTWFQRPKVDLRAKLIAQKAIKTDPKLRLACDAYLEFLELGGEVRFRDLTTALIRKHLENRIPILTGLSATYLYQIAREAPPDFRSDDVGGLPAGHFVVLCGYDTARRKVLVADPLHPNPLASRHQYSMDINRVLCSILLGVVTYDANLLILEPDGATEAATKSGGRSGEAPARDE